MSVKIIAATSVALVAAAGVAVAGPADAATARGTTHLHATKHHNVVVAKTIRPGLAHLHNDGSRQILIVRKRHEGADKLAVYLSSHRSSTRRKLLAHFVFVDLLSRHADDFVSLSKGTYYLVADASKVSTSKIRSVTVRGTKSNAVRPANTRALTVGAKGVLNGSTTGLAHPYLRLRNTTKTVQIVVIYRFEASATEAQIDDLIAHPTYEKLDKLVDLDQDGAAFFVAGPKQDVTSQLALGRGRYVELAFAELGPRRLNRLTLT